ncbi:hypothetical protein PRABACTJOHN_00655 [Parabacteroides johnsonii DSM 18315]|uniref:Uncharacterized protein n=1 Tax=Parabacteroides johnsonii DSM 18315 TaxID=537006 RepID=B7B6L1_9BACT|nr:hypothetical protein PRABACTJOHN_00655 [Parabacteroides johnsonii DSM 18315]
MKKLRKKEAPEAFSPPELLLFIAFALHRVTGQNNTAPTYYKVDLSGL